MKTETLSTSQHESEVEMFRPEPGEDATNSNDVRRFIYAWFTYFEHKAEVGAYLKHLTNDDMHMAFPGAAALTTHADFTQWYENLLAQTLWNFHDISRIEIKETSNMRYVVSFIVDWYGEVKADSDQRAGWQSRPDSNLYHHRVRQTWNLIAGNEFRIEKMIVGGADTPSPIAQ